MPGFGAYHATQWHDSDSEEHEERDEHNDPPRLATTSNAQEDPVPIARTSKRCRETEARSRSSDLGYLPGLWSVLRLGRAVDRHAAVAADLGVDA